MWWGQVPPWMQGMGQGQQQGMTPGAGMPPYGRAPMNMNPVQMGPPGSIPGAPPVPPQQGQQSINPAQMGMLSQMLAQQTQKPMAPQAQGSAVAGAGAAGGPLPGGAAATPAGGQLVPGQGVTPELLGYLRQVAPAMFGSGFNWG